MVNPSDDGLGRIRAASPRAVGIWWRRRRSRWWPPPLLGLAVGGVAVLSQNDDGGPERHRRPVGQPPTTPAASRPSRASRRRPRQSNTTEPESTATSRSTTCMDDGLALRLYREFTTQPGEEPGTAVDQMFAEPAIDPDYSSSWPEATESLGEQVR